jgi:hemoglobin/transferrin/lactoferrin receptor protein
MFAWKKEWFWAFLFYLLSMNLLAQKITVLDASNLSAIKNAEIIIALQNSVFTGPEGTALLNNIASADSITVFADGYIPSTVSVNAFRNGRLTVYLQALNLKMQAAEISAFRLHQQDKNLSFKTSKIPLKEALLQGAQSTADMIGASGEVLVQKSQQGGGSPMIRGFAANRVLICVDGMRINNAISRSGNLHQIISIGGLTVDEAEIIFSPGALMLGSDAIGGAMNFKTLKPLTLEENNQKTVSGNVMLRTASANFEKTAHADLNFSTKKSGIYAAYTFSDFDDLMMGSRGPDAYLRNEYQSRINDKDTILKNDKPRRQVQSGYQQHNVLFKYRLVPKKGTEVNYAFHFSESSDIPRYDRLIERNAQGNFRDGEWYYGPQRWSMHMLSIEREDSTRIYDRFKLSLAYQHFHESRHNRNFNSNWRNNRNEFVEAINLNYDFEKKIKSNYRINYGVDAVFNTVNSEAHRHHIVNDEWSRLSTRYPDQAIWNSYGVYVQQNVKIGRKTDVMQGIRYTTVALSALADTLFFPLPDPDLRLRNRAWTGNIGMIYRISPRLTWNVNLTTAFRAPNVDDAAKVFDSEPGSVIVPNPDLKAEYAWQGESGFSFRINSKSRIHADFFYTFLDQAMVRRPSTFNGADSIVYDGTLSQVLSIQNAAGAYVYGLQLGADVEIIPNLLLTLRLNWQKGEEEDDDGNIAALRHAPPFFGQSALTWQKDKLTLRLLSIYQGMISYENMALSERAKPHLYVPDANGNPFAPAWLTVNLNLAYQAASWMELIGGIDNITDQRYRTYSSGITAPGRNFRLAVRCRI